MSEKITKLSDDLLKRLPLIRDKWIKIGLSTEPANRQEAEKGVDLAYQAVGLQPPKIKIWLDSPYQGFIASCILQKGIDDKVLAKIKEKVGAESWHSAQQRVGKQYPNQQTQSVAHEIDYYTFDSVMNHLGSRFTEQVLDDVSEHLHDKVRLHVYLQVADKVEDQICDNFGIGMWHEQGDDYKHRGKYYYGIKYQLEDALDGSGNAPMFAYLNFFNVQTPELGVLPGWELVAQNCDKWWPYEDVVLLTERPTSIQLDNQKEAHSVAGSAVQYADGFPVYMWHGMRIPAHFITEPVTSEKIRSEKNAERRRILMEIFIDKSGTDSILETLEANILDDAPCLDLERKLVQICGDHYLYCTNGTLEHGKRRNFLLAVPTIGYHDRRTSKDFPSPKTAHQASAWTYGIDPKHYQEQVRT